MRRFLADFGSSYAASGLVGFIFAATGPVAIILAVGAQGGLAESDLSSWIFGAFFVNGLISIAFCLWYRQQLVFFWTFPVAVLVGPALGHLTFPEVIGAYIATATEAGDFPRVVLGIAVMCILVTLFNRLLWRPLYAFGERRLRLG